jgi:endonuclease/exonuclease/phosphatase family metal-dependent hydrolase
VDPGARHAQKRLIARFLAERAGEHPLIVAGDLNAETCESGAGGPFPGGVPLEDASCGVGPTVGGVRLGMIQGALFPAEIDSVYVCGAEPTDKRTRLFSSPQAGGHLSDHDAVLAAVRIADEGSPQYGCRL